MHKPWLLDITQIKSTYFLSHDQIQLRQDNPQDATFY